MKDRARGASSVAWGVLFLSLLTSCAGTQDQFFWTNANIPESMWAMRWNQDNAQCTDEVHRSAPARGNAPALREGGSTPYDLSMQLPDGSTATGTLTPRSTAIPGQGSGAVSGYLEGQREAAIMDAQARIYMSCMVPRGWRLNKRG